METVFSKEFVIERSIEKFKQVCEDHVALLKGEPKIKIKESSSFWRSFVRYRKLMRETYPGNPDDIYVPDMERIIELSKEADKQITDLILVADMIEQKRDFRKKKREESRP